MQPHYHNIERGIAFALLAFFAFSISDGLRKMMALDHSVIDILFWQGIFAFIMLNAAAPLLGGFRSIFAKEKLKWHLVRGALISLNTTFSIIAVSNMPLMDAYTIFFLTPFVTTIMSMFFFGERFGKYRWMAIAFGFIGGFIAFRPGFAELNPAYGFACACVFTFAFSSTIARHLGVSKGMLAFGFWPILILLVSIIIYNQGTIPPAHDLRFLSYCLVIGVCYGSALVMIAYSYTLAPASVVSPYQYVQIVFALGFGYFMFNNIPDPYKLAGSSIIIGSGVFLFIRERIVRQREIQQTFALLDE